MAAYDVDPGDYGVHEFTLVAGEESTVTFAEDVPVVEITNLNGAARVYFAINNGMALVAGPRTQVIPAAVTSVIMEPPGAGPTVVSLISSGSPLMSVTRVP